MSSQEVDPSLITLIVHGWALTTLNPVSPTLNIKKGISPSTLPSPLLVSAPLHSKNQEREKINKWCSIILAMMFYDIWLTFPVEVEKIWKQRFSGLTVLWVLVNRIDFFFDHVSYFFWFSGWIKDLKNRWVYLVCAIFMVTGADWNSFIGLLILTVGSL